MDAGDSPSQILGAMAKIALGLGRLHKAKPDRYGRLLHRCASTVPCMWPLCAKHLAWLFFYCYLQVAAGAVLSCAASAHFAVA